MTVTRATRTSPAICVLGLLAACGPQQAGIPTLPAPVAQELDALAAQCTEAGGNPHTGTAVLRADLTADGALDYVLDAANVTCEGAPSLYGDRDKVVSVFVADGRDAKRAFTDSTFGARLEGTGASARLWLTVTGARCGKAPAPDFASEKFCDRALLWDPGTKSFDYAPVEDARIVQ